MSPTIVVDRLPIRTSVVRDGRMIDVTTRHLGVPGQPDWVEDSRAASAARQAVDWVCASRSPRVSQDVSRGAAEGDRPVILGTFRFDCTGEPRPVAEPVRPADPTARPPHPCGIHPDDVLLPPEEASARRNCRR